MASLTARPAPAWNADSVGGDPPTGRRLAPYQHPAFRAVMLAGLLLLVLFPLWWPSLERTLLRAEQVLAQSLPVDRVAGLHWLALPAVGLIGGVLASISPCVLPLIPLNAAYIGAGRGGGAHAVLASTGFVAGAVLALSVLGLFADLAGAVFVEYRGPVRLAVGAILLLLGACKAEILPLPRLPVMAAARKVGPVAAGATFALITTPCASPLLLAVLAAAAAPMLPGLSVATMVCFAIGYTALVFAAGVGGAGTRAHFARQAAGLQAGAAALLFLAGLGFAISGLLWFG
ncbi:MAG: cytochrome C biogenesis protein CcdA [Gemmatimonadetes bacterium]|nr:cytochrome C biogenesis protein CcdA [Gemmatimonadota bacterium]